MKKDREKKSKSQKLKEMRVQKDWGGGVDSEFNALHTTLTIYNILGQEVVTLVNEVKEPGYYTVTWNRRNAFGNEVATGVHLYRLTAGTFTATKKMVLMK